MCPECEEYFVKAMEVHRLGEFLDRFDKPVLVVDSAGSDIAANQKMADLLGKSRREYHGLLGNEISECRHSRNPSGCGQTIHCVTCTIRLLIEQILHDGMAHTDVPAYFDRDGKRNYYFISIKSETNHISLRIGEILNTHAGLETARGTTF